MNKYSVNGMPVIAESISQATSIFWATYNGSPFIKLVVKPWLG